MSENLLLTITEETPDRPKVYILAKGEFGKNVLNGLSLPKTDSLIIEYLEEGEAPQKAQQEMDIVMEISHNVNHLTLQWAGHITDMLFVIGPSIHNSRAIIQKQQECYFVHSQSIDEYRTFISMITNMLFSPGLINVDLSDIRTSFYHGTQGLIASSYRTGDLNSGRAEFAIKEVIEYLTKQISNLKETKSCLVNITAGIDFYFQEFIKIGDMLENTLGEDTIIVLGTSLEMNSQGILVSAIAMM